MLMKSVFARVPLLHTVRPKLVNKNYDLDERIRYLLKSQYTYYGNEKKPEEYHNKTPLLFGSGCGIDIETQKIRSTIEHFNKPYQLNMFAKSAYSSINPLDTEHNTLYRTWINYDTKMLRILMLLEKVNERNKLFEKYYSYLNQPKWYPNIEQLEKYNEYNKIYAVDFESFCDSYKTKCA